MNKCLELVQLTKNPGDGYIELVASDVMGGYTYVISSENYDRVSREFGGDGESDMALAEDPREWLVQLLDAKSFAEMEKEIVGYFGGAQQAIAAMSVGSLIGGGLFAESKSRQIERAEPAEPETGSPAVILEGLYDEIDGIELDETPSDEESVASVLEYLRGIEAPNLHSAFLALFAKHATKAEVRLQAILYKALLSGLADANKVVPDATENLLGVIMDIFINQIGGQA